MPENTDMNARVYHALRNFYHDNKQWIFQYYDFAIEYNAEMVIRNIPPEELNVLLTDCKILILTANSVEQNIVTRKLYEEMNRGKDFEHKQSQLREAFVDDICVYQFSKVNDINIVHIHPGEMGSFTKEGSARAVRNALLRFQPKLVVSLGVAFGIDPVNQELGSVLLSKGIIPYDVFNKDTDGLFKLDSKQIYSTHSALKAWNVLVRNPDFHLEKKSTRKSLIGGKISFKWENGFMLSGGSVLSNEVKKQALLKAAKKISEYEIIGGEMEGTGIYFECADLSIPCIIIKGICDYGAAKNEWDEVIKEVDSHPVRYVDNTNKDIKLPIKEIRGERIKDCVQAFATDNAVEALFRLLRFDSQFFEYIKPEMVYREAKEKRFPQMTPGFMSGLREVFIVLILHLGLLAALFLINRFFLKSLIDKYLFLNKDFPYGVVDIGLFIITLLILIISCAMNIRKTILYHPCEIKHPWISFTFLELNLDNSSAVLQINDYRSIYNTSVLWWVNLGKTRYITQIIGFRQGNSSINIKAMNKFGKKTYLQIDYELSNGEHFAHVISGKQSENSKSDKENVTYCERIYSVDKSSKKLVGIQNAVIEHVINPHWIQKLMI